MPFQIVVETIKIRKISIQINTIRIGSTGKPIPSITALKYTLLKFICYYFYRLLYIFYLKL